MTLKGGMNGADDPAVFFWFYLATLNIPPWAANLFPRPEVVRAEKKEEEKSDPDVF